MLFVADRETGTFIVPVSSIETGLAAIDYFEETDRKEGEYTPDFYDIVDEDHISQLRNDYAFQKALEKVIGSGKPLKFTT